MGYVLPGWLDEILDFIGINFPNVDEDDYREMAEAMREFADAFDGHAGEAQAAVGRLLSSSEGWSVDALQEHWGKVKSSHLDQLPEVSRQFADAMDVVADVIYGMKIKAEIELGVLAASVGVSMGLAVVTGGLSALIGAAEVAAMREVVRRLVKEAAEQIVDQVIAMVTEPVAAKLEDMVSDAILDLADDAIHPSGGGDGGGAAGTQLNSAHGPSGGGSGGGGGRMRIDHAEYEKGAGDLGRLGERSLQALNGPLDRAHNAQGRARGKDALTAPIDGIVDGATKALKKTVKAVIKHNGETVPKNMRKTSEQHKRNEKANQDALDKILKGRDGKDDPRPPARNDPPADGRNSEGRPAKADRPADPALSREGREAENGCYGGDPIDMESGEVFLAQSDLTLPAVLPLEIGRTHRSNYRHGRFFGPSWASVLDERLETVSGREGGLWWRRSDGSSLRYDHVPDLVGEQVQPSEGRRLPLTCLQGRGSWDLAVHDARTGLTRRFLPAGDGASAGVWWLMEVEDRNGNTLILERADDGTPLSLSHSSGGYHVAVHTADGLVTALGVGSAESGTPVVSYRHDADRNLSEVINSSGLPTRFGYDGDHRMTSWTDSNDSTFRYVYDATGRVERTVGPDGYLSSQLTFDVERRVTRYTDSTGAVTTYHFNELGQAVAETDPLGHVSRTEWDRYDRVLSRTDPLGRTTAFEYDEHGNTAAVTYPDGSRSSATYNRHHLPVAVTSAEGPVRHYEYDGFGNRIAMTDPAGLTTRFTYNDRGHLTSVTNALGETTTVRCDSAGLPTEVTDPNGAATSCRRDAFGRPAAVTDPLGATTRLEWTVEGKLSRRTAPDGAVESWTYDGEGNRTSHTDALGTVSRFEYTHFDLLKARTGPDGVRYEFEHDTELRLRKVINPQALTWSYEYDSAGRLISETDFDDRVQEYHLDAAGRLASRTTPSGDVITFERDVLDRPVTKDVAGSITTYAYDATGGLARATSPDAELTLERDEAGRLVSETVDSRTLTYTYDGLGRRVGRVTPTGAASSWTYDTAGNRVELTTSGRTITFAHDGAGRETSRRIGSTLTFTNTFDPLGRLTEQELSGPSEQRIQRRAYSYRADGNLAGLDDHLNGARRFDLDAAGRVTAVQASGWAESYAYDEAGNQASASWPSAMPGQEAVGERTYSGTRISSAGGVRYEHDAAGRVTLRQKPRISRKPDTWRYVWDAEDRLQSVLTPDGVTWRYLYDPLGRRIAKQRLAADDSGAVVEQTDFTWDGTTLCEQTTWAPGTSSSGLTLTWDHDGLHPLAQTERMTAASASQGDIDSRFYAIVTDLVGTPTELVDEQGDIAWRTRSTLWGATGWNRSATAYTPLRFPGQYHDPETGLHYNFHRYYNPHTARYLSPDPLGLRPADNPIAYVHNPHSWADPLGLAPESDGCPKGKSKGRAQHLQRNEDAEGDHTVFERDENGRVTRYQTWIREPRAPEGWRPGPRFRGTGNPHGGMEPPLYYPKTTGKAFPAEGENLPAGY
ncbi:RHS repeat-associated core domain-containing protein [Streptomyces boluensis]|uniref:Type IV secretion protein Rhs n=1 Tax=Streptomyces boluensis TaxID=1775135 RepID=A0A964UPS3_9ACTN|nr:RHS repeat-associated core domain-containing protein [Streptomyces boluensis]NBE52145.1 type IV secretion protein Rhs [Streptomyces boluensis]